MFLSKNSIRWKLLDQPEFLNLRNVLDNTMKERTASGLGVRRSSDIISLSHEDTIFQKGILGEPCTIIEDDDLCDGFTLCT